MMKAKTARLISGSILAGICAFAVGCSSNPHKAKDIDTKMEKKAIISGNENVGVKDGNLVVQKKVQMNEELRRLQNEVYSLEDRVYGNRKYGSKGLYGSIEGLSVEVDFKRSRWRRQIEVDRANRSRH
jgi:hypothetical protein